MLGDFHLSSAGRDKWVWSGDLVSIIVGILGYLEKLMFAIVGRRLIDCLPVLIFLIGQFILLYPAARSAKMQLNTLIIASLIVPLSRLCGERCVVGGILPSPWYSPLAFVATVLGSSFLCFSSLVVAVTGMADFVPDRVVIDAAQRNRDKYMPKCAVIRYEFLPFSFSSLRELEENAVTLLKRIRMFYMAQDIRARATIHIFNMISFAIVKGVMSQISKLLRHTSIIASGPNFFDALCVFNTSMETDFLSNPSEIAAPKLMKKMADIYFTRVTKDAESTFSLSSRQMALWRSQMEDHTSDWLRVVPISGLGQNMNVRLTVVLCVIAWVSLYFLFRSLIQLAQGFLIMIFMETMLYRVLVLLVLNTVIMLCVILLSTCVIVQGFQPIKKLISS
ncbi:hypothetical protein Tco_0933210 [Tanacetum coccineum]